MTKTPLGPTSHNRVKFIVIEFSNSHESNHAKIIQFQYQIPNQNSISWSKNVSPIFIQISKLKDEFMFRLMGYKQKGV